MITQSQIRELSDDIVWKFNPEKIILFGSYAYGTPTPDSDVDLLVIRLGVLSCPSRPSLRFTRS